MIVGKFRFIFLCFYAKLEVYIIYMKKIYIIIICIAAFMLIVIGLFIVLLYFYQPCGGIMGISCRAGYECNARFYDSAGESTDSFGYCVQSQNNSNVSDNGFDDLVEYNDSFGSTCPVGIKFIGSKTSPEIKCQCPIGYEMSSDIVGYASGDSCYGPGTECPIMSSECILKS